MFMFALISQSPKQSLRLISLDQHKITLTHGPHCAEKCSIGSHIYSEYHKSLCSHATHYGAAFFSTSSPSLRALEGIFQETGPATSIFLGSPSSIQDTTRSPAIDKPNTLTQASKIEHYIRHPIKYPVLTHSGDLASLRQIHLFLNSFTLPCIDKPYTAISINQFFASQRLYHTAPQNDGIWEATVSSPLTMHIDKHPKKRGWGNITACLIYYLPNFEV